AFQVAAGELLGRLSGVFEAADRHQQEHVGRTARDVLALAAVALRLHHRLALGLVAHLAAIASAFEFHDASPFAVTGISTDCVRLGKPFSPKRKGLQLALEPLNGQGIAGYVPEPELWARPLGIAPRENLHV